MGHEINPTVQNGNEGGFYTLFLFTLRAQPFAFVLVAFYTKLCVCWLCPMMAVLHKHEYTDTNSNQPKLATFVRYVARTRQKTKREREKRKIYAEKPPFLLLVYRDGTFLGGRFVPRDPRSPDTK